jgi:AraC family transcriptional regulator
MRAPRKADEPEGVPVELGVAREFIGGRFRRNVTLGEVAAAARLSPFHFHRLFRRHFGKTPKRLVDELRIAEAKRLALGGMRLVDVARAVGFAHQSHLSQRFKQLTGESPSQWLRAARRERNA